MAAESVDTNPKQRGQVEAGQAGRRAVVDAQTRGRSVEGQRRAPAAVRQSSIVETRTEGAA